MTSGGVLRSRGLCCSPGWGGVPRCPAGLSQPDPEPASWAPLEGEETQGPRRPPPAAPPSPCCSRFRQPWLRADGSMPRAVSGALDLVGVPWFCRLLWTGWVRPDCGLDPPRLRDTPGGHRTHPPLLVCLLDPSPAPGYRQPRRRQEGPGPASAGTGLCSGPSFWEAAGPDRPGSASHAGPTPAGLRAWLSGPVSFTVVPAPPGPQGKGLNAGLSA